KETENHPAEHSGETDQGAQLYPAHARASLEELGLDHPHHVDPMGDEHEDGDPAQDLRIPFRVPRHQHDKRDQELGKEKERNVSPAAFEAVEVIAGFFRKVRIPDQQELTEADVRVENGEGEHELPDVMQMVVVHEVLEMPALEKPEGEHAE